MSLISLLRKLRTGSQSSRTNHKNNRSSRLTVESLEKRDLPSVTFISGLYRDLLGRVPGQSELNFWSTRMNTGATTASVAQNFAFGSEFRGNEIRADYQTMLGRSPSNSEVSAWLALMNAGTTEQQMEAGFLASTEYYNRHGGSNAGWIGGLYGDVLNR